VFKSVSVTWHVLIGVTRLGVGGWVERLSSKSTVRSRLSPL
jgi:hypothetical protein